jgi:hypothetical protein
MNKEWARQRLNGYLAAIREYEAAYLASDFSQQAYEKVVSLEPAAKAIMKRVILSIGTISSRRATPSHLLLRSRR